MNKLQRDDKPSSLFQHICLLYYTIVCDRLYYMHNDKLTMLLRNANFIKTFLCTLVLISNQNEDAKKLPQLRTRNAKFTGPPVCKLCSENHMECIFEAGACLPQTNKVLWMEINVHRPGQVFITMIN